MNKSLVKNMAISAIETLPGLERLATAALEALILRRFYDSVVGREYGVGRKEKTNLVSAFQRINREIVSATYWLDYVVLATRVLEIPASTPGALVECGCYKGASSAALSLLAAVVNRPLIVCDSFEGLPADELETHVYPHLQAITSYERGLFLGTLDEVRANISSWGCVRVCQFVPGFFSDTLSGLSDPVAFAFLDVDLASSMRDCLRYVWPLLVENGFVYTDDSCDMEVVKIWFDPEFWGELHCSPPGYVGSGCGLPALSCNYSSLGYSIKVADPGTKFKSLRFW